MHFIAQIISQGIRTSIGNVLIHPWFAPPSNFQNPWVSLAPFLHTCYPSIRSLNLHVNLLGIPLFSHAHPHYFQSPIPSLNHQQIIPNSPSNVVTKREVSLLPVNLMEDNVLLVPIIEFHSVKAHSTSNVMMITNNKIIVYSFHQLVLEVSSVIRTIVDPSLTYKTVLIPTLSPVHI